MFHNLVKPFVIKSDNNFVNLEIDSLYTIDTMIVATNNSKEYPRVNNTTYSLPNAW